MLSTLFDKMYYKHLRRTLTFPNGKNLDSSKLKEFADDNSKLDENSREFSKLVENTVGKGEVAHYKHFLLFPQCFQKTFTADMQKPRLFWKSIKTQL